MQRFQRLFYETIQRRDGLSKYDLVVVGNLAAGQFARQFYKQTNDIYSILLVNNQAQYQLRDGPYARVLEPTSLVDGTSVSITNGIGVRSVDFDRKSVDLSDGRQVGYDRLVVAQEFQDDFKSIEGLTESLEDPKQPVYCRTINFNARVNKDPWEITKFAAGDIYYYIPEFPFNGQDDHISPLLLLDEMIKRNSSQTESLTLRYHIVTPNSQLFPSNFQDQEATYKEYLAKHNVQLLLNTQLLSIDKSNRNIQLQTGNTSSIGRSYDGIYLQGLKSSPLQGWIKGLVKDGAIDINPKTLQHNKYKNIFSIGAPNFSSFYTEEQVRRQIDLAKINVLMSFQGQKCIEQDTTKQFIYYYQGQKQIIQLDNEQPSKLSPLKNQIKNRRIVRHTRYLWQTTLKGRLQFLNELQQRYVSNRLYGSARNQQRQDIIQQISEYQDEPELDFKIPVRKTDTTEIQDQLFSLGLLKKSKGPEIQVLQKTQASTSDAKPELSSTSDAKPELSSPPSAISTQKQETRETSAQESKTLISTTNVSKVEQETQQPTEEKKKKKKISKKSKQ